MEVQVVEEGRASGRLVANATISNVEDEVLINDVLGEEPVIVILGLASSK